MKEQRTWFGLLAGATASKGCLCVQGLVSAHVMTGQPAVEQGEEGEAEERRQGEEDGVGAFRHLDQRLPDGPSEHTD